MNRSRLVAIAILLIVALAASAQQAAEPAGTDKAEHGHSGAQGGVSSLDQHVKMLAEFPSRRPHETAAFALPSEAINKKWGQGTCHGKN